MLTLWARLDDSCAAFNADGSAVPFRWSSGCFAATVMMCSDALIVPMATAPTFLKAMRAGATRSLKTPQ